MGRVDRRRDGRDRTISSPQLKTLTAFGISTTGDYLRLLVVIIGVVLFALDRFVRSRFGRAYFAIHESETAASSIGIDSAAIKRQAYAGPVWRGSQARSTAISSAISDPRASNFHRSIEILVMAVGGLGSLAGQVVGAIALTLLPRQLELFEDFKFIIYGVVLVAIFVVMPRGIAGWPLLPPRMIGACHRRGRTAAPAAEIRRRDPGLPSSPGRGCRAPSAA